MLLFYLAKYKWIIICLGVMLAGYSLTSHYEQKGYDRAINDIQKKANLKISKATKDAFKRAEEKISKTITNQKIQFEAERLRYQREQIADIKTKEVIKYVDKIHIKDGCNTVGDDIISLLNKSISTVNSTRGEPP